MIPLPIDSEEALALLHELAEREGKDITALVIDLAREKLGTVEAARPFNQRRFDYWMRVGEEIRATTDPALFARDPDDELYDERGLPA